MLAIKIPCVGRSSPNQRTCVPRYPLIPPPFPSIQINFNYLVLTLLYHFYPFYPCIICDFVLQIMSKDKLT